MSSNVGLTTPRGSGTSGYVQRNSAFMKPRNAGYGAPYPPLSSSSGPGSGAAGPGFRQRVPDKKILEHDRLRRVEVEVLEERERLEEENERIEEEELEKAKKTGNKGGKKEKKKAGDEEGETGSDDDSAGGERILSEEEIEERCEALRARLLKEIEEGGSAGAGGGGKRNIKAYRVHELAEAKIEESERLRRALGIKEDGETGEISSFRRERRERRD